MRSTPAFASILASAALVACGGGSSTPDAPVVVIPDAAIDAPPPPPDEPPPPPADFTCENDVPPTTAPATISVLGSVNDIDISSGTPMQVAVAGATIEAFRNGVATPIATDTSDDGTGGTTAGEFQLSLTTNGIPLDGFVEARKAGHHPVRIYPPNPLAADVPMLPALLVNNLVFGLVPGDPDVAVLVLDCSGAPIEGATLTVKQGGVDVGTVNDGSQFQPGLFFVEGVPAGDLVVGGTAQGHTLHAHTITSVDGTLITTVVTPRP